MPEILSGGWNLTITPADHVATPIATHHHLQISFIKLSLISLV